MKRVNVASSSKSSVANRPTTGCRCPAKTDHLFSRQEQNIAQRGAEKEEKDEKLSHSGLGLGICAWVFWKERGWVCGQSSN